MVTRKPAASKKVPTKIAKAPRKAVATTRVAEPDPVPSAVVEQAAELLVAAAEKQKLVRDSFTIPKGEFEVLGLLKARLAQLIRPTKKGELVRAGIAILARMNDAELLASVNAVRSLPTGRPRKEKAANGKGSKQKS